ncbi:MAG: hypothetical protein U0892_12170 [Pirellulales bacterium]
MDQAHERIQAAADKGRYELFQAQRLRERTPFNSETRRELNETERQILRDNVRRWLIADGIPESFMEHIEAAIRRSGAGEVGFELFDVLRFDQGVFTGLHFDAWRPSPEELLGIIHHPGMRTISALSLRDWMVSDDCLTSILCSPHLSGIEHLDLGNSWDLRWSFYGTHCSGVTADRQPWQAELTEAGIHTLCDSLVGRNLRSLSLLGVPVGQEAAERIAATEWSQLEHLVVSQTYIAAEGIQALAGSPRLANLRSLEVSGHEDFWMKREGIEAILCSPYLLQLRSLNIAASWTDGKELLDALDRPESSRLRALNVSNFRLSDEQVRSLLHSPHLQQLETLVLWDPTSNSQGLWPNELTLETAMEVHSNSDWLRLMQPGYFWYCAAFEGNEWSVPIDLVTVALGEKVTSLDFTSGLDFPALDRFMSSLRAASLRALDLTDNNLAGGMLNRLLLNSRVELLSRFVLDMNPIGDDGIDVLCKWMSDGRIQSLSARDCGLSDAAKKRLQEVAGTNSVTLTTE